MGAPASILEGGTLEVHRLDDIMSISAPNGTTIVLHVESALTLGLALVEMAR